MYHIPERTRHVNVNPWPQAVRRILIGFATLALIAFLRSFLEWLFDHTAGQGKLEFYYPSLVYLAIAGGLVAYLVMRREQSETLDSGTGQIRLVLINAFLAAIAVYGLWDRFDFGVLFNPSAPEASPYPYRGTILLLSTWLYILVTLQMIFTVIIALKDARTNVYETDTEPL